MNIAPVLEINNLSAYEPNDTVISHPLLQKLLQKIEDLKIVEDIATKQARQLNKPFELSHNAQKVIRQLEADITKIAISACEALKNNK